MTHATARVKKNQKNDKIGYENEVEFSDIKQRDMLRQEPTETQFRNSFAPKETDDCDGQAQSPCKPATAKSAISSFAQQADMCAKAAGKGRKKSVSPNKSASKSPAKKSVNQSSSIALNVRQATSPEQKDASPRQSLSFAAKSNPE